MWQFFAAVEGYRQAHDPKAGNGLSMDEEDDLAAWLGIPDD